MSKVKYRHEHKIYINMGDYYTIKSRIKHIMKMDRNSVNNQGYFIRSIYFDDIYDKALFEKVAGLSNREKFRIRFYNNDSSYIKLEKKIKHNSKTAKFSDLLTKDEVDNIFNGDIEWMKDSDRNLIKEFYIKINSELLKPKTIVDYEREAYTYAPGNVRITFDKDIKTGLLSNDLFEGDLPTVKSIDPGLIIMEVKYDEFLPNIIRELIQVDNRRITAVSKYALCRAWE